MLTRHLYRADEVRASLRYALMKKSHMEASFWGLELLDSLMFSELLEDCLWVWLYGIGISGLGLLEKIGSLIEGEEISADNLLDLVHLIVSWPKRDSSVGWLLEKGLTDVQPDMLVRKGDGCPVSMAILQGKSVLAWCLLRCRWSHGSEPSGGQAADFLRFDLVFPEFMKAQFPWEVRAVWVLATCWATVGGSPATERIPEEIVEKIQIWKECEGRRERRAYEIRPEAIQFTTERSFQPNTIENLKELREPEKGLEGCPFWESVAEDMGGWKQIRRNADTREAFYDLYFPDDIPDEWSTADQKKSHGHGLFVDTNTRIGKYNKNLGNIFRGIAVRGIRCWTVVNRDVEDDYSTLYEKGQGRWEEAMKSWDLRGRKKKLRPM